MESHKMANTKNIVKTQMYNLISEEPVTIIELLQVCALVACGVCQ